MPRKHKGSKKAQKQLCSDFVLRLKFIPDFYIVNFGAFLL